MSLIESYGRSDTTRFVFETTQYYPIGKVSKCLGWSTVSADSTESADGLR